MQVFQDAGDARAQIVVEQNRARVKVFQPQAAFAADHRLQDHRLAVGQADGGVLGDLWVDRSDAHIQSSHLKNALQLHHIGQIKGVARVVLRNHQEVAGLGADFFNRRHRRLHRQGQHLLGQVVPPAREQVGVHGRQLEAGVADVHRGVKRWGVLHPLESKPALDGRHGVQDALLKLVDRAGQGRRQVRNHVCPLLANFALPKHHPFHRGQALDAHGSSGVKLIGGDADFGPQAVFKAIGKTRAGVDHHAGRVHLTQKPLRMAMVRGQNGIGVVAGTVLCPATVSIWLLSGYGGG